MLLLGVALVVFLLPIPLALRAAHAPAPSPAPASPERTTPIEAQFLEEGDVVRPVGESPRLEAVPREALDPAEEEPAVEPPVEDLPRDAGLSIDVLDEHDRGVPGARVEVFSVDQRSGAERRTVRATDARGRLLCDLPAGWAQVVAWSGEATSEPLSLDLDGVGDLDVALHLYPALGVAGRVVDAASGLPVAGARISFWTFSERDEVVTGSDGTFRHPRYPLVPGSPTAQQVRVAAQGFGSSVRYLEVSAEGTWTLHATDATGSDAHGTGEPWLELALVPELVLRGGVRSADGTPLPGARVSAEGFVHVLPGLASRDGAEATTDEQGRFLLEGLRSDLGHALLVTAPGHAALDLEVPAGRGERSLDLVLAPEALLTGVVLDSEGLPAEDIEIALHAAGEAELPAHVAARASALDAGARIEGRLLRTRTAADGTFAFRSLNAGDYVVEVIRDQGVLVEEPVLVTDGEEAALLELRLPTESLVLVGVVRGDHGAIPNARVDVLREGLVSTVTADAEGRFRVAGLAVAEYELVSHGRCPRTGLPLEGAMLAWSHDRPVVRLGER